MTTFAAALLCAVLAVSGLASAVAPRDGYYDGASANNDNGNISLALELQVSRNGHELKRIDVSYIDFTCLGNVDASLLLPANRTATLNANHSFSVALPSKDSSSDRANGGVVLSGTFGSNGSVSGKLAFTGSGLLTGCHRTIIWKGQVRPLFDYFTGQVVQGSQVASISFYRTIEAHPNVTDFTVGVLTAACPGGSPAQISLQSGYSLGVHTNMTFGGNVFFTSGDAGHIGGEFQNTTHATGTVSYAGRDDCSYDLRWSAQRAATNVLGPFNFYS